MNALAPGRRLLSSRSGRTNDAAAIGLLLVAWCLLSGNADAAESGPKYRAPRLANGQPDLQGTWDNLDVTPLERPPGFDTLIISPAQAAEIERRFRERRFDPKVPQAAPEFFQERIVRPIRGELRSSIIIDPFDGRLPGTARFDKEIETLRPAWVSTAFDGPEQRDGSERCLGNPASQPPILYSPATNLHQIVQADDTVLFFSESMHDARLIRLNSKHVPSTVTGWLGDSIGWWEGDTLVVETKYFSPSDRGRRLSDLAFLTSPNTVVVERFTRESHDELNYVFTVEDAAYYTRRWTGETHFFRTDDRILEYACHEGNYSMRNILSGARADEAAATNK